MDLIGSIILLTIDIGTFGINKLKESYEWHRLCVDSVDPRVKNWPLVRDYHPTVFISTCYLILVFVGPYMMRNRRSFHLRKIIICHNTCLIAMNGYIAYEFLYNALAAGYTYPCQPLNHDVNNSNEMRFAKAMWWFFVSKIIELLDSLFFILRKRNNQLSFLHVYHHYTVIFLVYVTASWTPGGQYVFGPFVNSIIHVIMYTYYAMSAFGPQYIRYLWWKIYVTLLQLTQFLAVLIYHAYSMATGCKYFGSHWAMGCWYIYHTSITALFIRFYYVAYIKKKMTAPIQEKRSKSLDSTANNSADVTSTKDKNGVYEPSQCGQKTTNVKKHI